MERLLRKLKTKFERIAKPNGNYAGSSKLEELRAE